MTPLSIGTSRIGAQSPVLVIAEIGVNHDGSVERAIQLVQAARRCGADAVKLQVFSADRLMHASAGMAAYQKERCADTHVSDMLRRYELPLEDLKQIVACAREEGLIPLATPFSIDDVETIAALDLPAIKIASPDLVNRPLLQRVALLGRPLIISTGAATMDEVSTTLQWLREWSARCALLHCVSSYPTRVSDANLGWIEQFERTFNVPVGFSDHTTEVFAGAFATAAGACVIEKHLTYDCRAEGPDHAASADPATFAQYVSLIRMAERMRGTGPKRVLECEKDVRTLSRQSLVLVRDVAAGERIAESDLTVQRPGTGIPPAQMAEAIGRVAARPLPRGTMLQWDMLADAA
jgi:N,N'-diacetyllegionaminate synthase